MAYELAKAFLQTEAALKRCQQLAGKISNRQDADLGTVVHVLAQNYGWTHEQIGSMTSDQVEVCLREILGEVNQLHDPGKSWVGCVGGEELREKLGIPPSRANAFEQQLNRKRKSLGDDNWLEAANPEPNKPRYLYRDSPQLRALAKPYLTS